MIEAGLMRDDHIGISSSGMGRPTQLLDVAVSEHLFVGVNVAGGSLNGVIVNARADLIAEVNHSLAEKTSELVGRSISRLVDELVDVARAPSPEGERPWAGARVENVAISGTGGSVAGTGILDNVTASYPIVSRIVDETEAVLLLEQWFGTGIEADSFVMVTVGDEIGSRFASDVGTDIQFLSTKDELLSSSFPPRSAGHPDATAHLPIAGASGICQYGHVGCATGTLATPAVLARARSGRILIGDSERRPFNLADLMYLADIGDEPSRRALSEYGANLATFVTMIARATSVADVILDGEGVVLLGSQWADESFKDGLTRFSVPGIAELRIVNRSGDLARKARAAAAVGIMRWLTGIES